MRLGEAGAKLNTLSAVNGGFVYDTRDRTVANDPITHQFGNSKLRRNAADAVYQLAGAPHFPQF